MRGETDFWVKGENIGQPEVIFRKMIFSVTAKHAEKGENDFLKSFSPKTNAPLKYVFVSNNPLKQLVYAFVFWSIVQFDGQFIFWFRFQFNLTFLLWHQVAFPAQEKRLDALILCTNVIFMYLEEYLKLTPEHMSDKAVALDELKEMHQRVSIWLSKS